MQSKDSTSSYLVCKKFINQIYVPFISFGSKAKLTVIVCYFSCREKENSSAFNLASKEHDDMWSEDIFMLVETGTSGHCHTYNPTTSSLADEGFYAMLGNKT